MKFEESAKRLKEAMAAKGLSQQELSNLSGVSKSNISHYVNGKNIPANYQAYLLSKVLDVSPEHLMCLDEAQNYIVVENNALQQEIAKMTEAQQQTLLTHAKKINSSNKGKK